MCGIIGIIGNNSTVSQTIFDSLTSLQHRGQDSAGIMTCDNKKIYEKKGIGLIIEVIKKSDLKFLKGSMGIGHVRYPTAGSNTISEAQPFYVNSPYGIALSHNGNLIETDNLKEELFNNGFRHVNSSSDSELMLNVLAAELNKCCLYKNISCIANFFEAMKNVYKKCKGGFAVVGMIPKIGMFAFRDPFGIRPLILGQNINNKEYMIASESSALESNNYKIVRDIQPGEVCFIDLQGNLTSKVYFKNQKTAFCAFEYIYFASPSSIINNISVYDVRSYLGRLAGRKISSDVKKYNFDLIVPIPDTGRYSALQISNILNIEYKEVIVKNPYIGRTFIQPDQKSRFYSIKKKFSFIIQEIKDKHLLLVDDSIVRGNTSKLIVNILRKLGAKKVSLLSVSPVIKYPNIYGIDMPKQEEFVSYNRSIQDIKIFLDLDNIFFLSIDDLQQSIQFCNKNNKINLDLSVFNGIYATNF